MRNLVILLCLTLAAACNDAPTPAQSDAARSPADVDGARLVAADSEPGNWMATGRTYAEERFGLLDQINDETVKDLGLAWYFDLETRLGLEATPLVIDGVMYTTGAWNIVYALDAKTGKELWRYDPELNRAWSRYTCCGPINRGPAAWKGKIYEGLMDGRLIAVDAASGKLVWETQTTDPNQPYSITGAPRIVKGKVIVGNGGGEFGVRGYVTAYDAETGEQVWRFYTVPGNPADGFESPAMEMAAKTWSGEWWKGGGGGTAWDSFSFDPELNLLYIGTGNGSPWSRDLRSPGGGDNLFLCSIVAVDPDTGEYKWHYQSVPGENWDYNCTQQMALLDLEIAGATRKTLVQAGKHGFLHVIDRVTGALISAEPFVETTWASHIDLATGRPVEIPENLYDDKQAKVVKPGPFGAHVWHPMSFSPKTGLLYFPGQETAFIYSRLSTFEHKPMQWNLAQNPNAEQPEGEVKYAGQGYLFAWDPAANKPAFKIPHAGPWNGGVLATAGNLLIQGAADGRFVIYRADSGEKLWETPIHTGAVAGPITYAVDGEQYIAVSAGWGGALPMVGNHMSAVHWTPGRLLAFKLGGAMALPPAPEAPVAYTPPVVTASPEAISKGGALYADYCSNCHGHSAVSGGPAPDLRWMAPEIHATFADIVLLGSRIHGPGVQGGMPPFGDVLNEDDLEAIRAYIVGQASNP